MKIPICVVSLALAIATGPVALGQDADLPGYTLEIEPSALTLEIGESSVLSALVRDASGEAVQDVRVVYYSRSRRDVSVSSTGRVEAYRPGDYTLSP